MKNLAVTLALCALSTAVMAQGRPSTTAMSCAAASALVSSRGAIVLGTGRDTYDRFVRDQSFCPHGFTTEPSFTPTTDNPQCMVGYRCIDLPRNDR